MREVDRIAGGRSMRGLSTQTDAVVETTRRNGGFATLRHLYLNTPTAGWKTKTPFASIRRIVQTSGRFFKIKPGLWALSDHRDRLPADVLALAQEREAGGRTASGVSHAYYQGLAAELGSLLGFSTYVPAQDGGRLCAGRRLRDLASFTKLPAFTYERVLRCARTIDVIWFNQREFPDSLIEVEHTTDFRGALGKFAELVDFSCRMLVVAHRVRRRQFDDVVRRTGFDAIRDRVRFLDYECLAELHASTRRQSSAKRRAGFTR